MKTSFPNHWYKLHWLKFNITPKLTFFANTDSIQLYFFFPVEENSPNLMAVLKFFGTISQFRFWLTSLSVLKPWTSKNPKWRHSWTSLLEFLKRFLKQTYFKLSKSCLIRSLWATPKVMTITILSGCFFYLVIISKQDDRYVIIISGW